MAILSDKDVGAILKSVTSFSDYIVLTEAPNERSCTLDELKEKLLNLDYSNSDDSICEERIFLERKPEVAIEKAMEIAKENDSDIIVVSRSLYLIGETRNHLLK